MTLTPAVARRPFCTARPVCVVRAAPHRRPNAARPSASAPGGPRPPPPRALPRAAALATGATGGLLAAAAFNESLSALSQWALAQHFSPEQGPAMLGAAAGYGALTLALLPLTAFAAVRIRRALQRP